MMQYLKLEKSRAFISVNLKTRKEATTIREMGEPRPSSLGSLWEGSMKLFYRPTSKIYISSRLNKELAQISEEGFEIEAQMPRVDG